MTSVGEPIPKKTRHQNGRSTDRPLVTHTDPCPSPSERNGTLCTRVRRLPAAGPFPPPAQSPGAGPPAGAGRPPVGPARAPSPSPSRVAAEPGPARSHKPGPGQQHEPGVWSPPPAACSESGHQHPDRGWLAIAVRWCAVSVVLEKCLDIRGDVWMCFRHRVRINGRYLESLVVGLEAVFQEPCSHLATFGLDWSSGGTVISGVPDSGEATQRPAVPQAPSQPSSTPQAQRLTVAGQRNGRRTVHPSHS